MASEIQLKAQREALDKVKIGFNVSAKSSDDAADAFNAVPLSERLAEVQAIVPRYNAVVVALQGAGQAILAGITATDRALSAVPVVVVPAPVPAPPSIPSIPSIPSASGSKWKPYNVAKAPVWRKPMRAFDFIEFPGIRLSNFTWGGTLNSWGGVCASNGDIGLAALGGHGDGSSPAVYQSNLYAADPILIQVGPDIPDSEKQKDVSHYQPSGLPSATHHYYAGQGDDELGLFMRFGANSVYGSGWVCFPCIDAWNIAEKKWEPEGTWGNIVGGGLGAALCKDYTTGNIYTMAGMWDRAQRKVTKLFPGDFIPPGQDNGDYVSSYYAASCFDSKRNRYMMLTNNHTKAQNRFLTINPDEGRWRTMDLQMESQNVTANDLLDSAGDFAFYHPLQDRIYIKRAAGKHLLVMDPETLVVRDQVITGITPRDSVNRVLGKMAPIPELGGCFYYPDGTHVGGFLALE